MDAIICAEFDEEIKAFVLGYILIDLIAQRIQIGRADGVELVRVDEPVQTV